VLVYALGSPTSGVPRSWAAAPGQPGINLLDDPDLAVQRLHGRIIAEKRSGDVVIVSLHWGPNWGHDIPEEDRHFARRLIDEAKVDIVHGHSSHHPKAIELYRGRPILFGCGDFLNDYEGISGHDEYRPDLVLAFRITVERDGSCSQVELLPFRIAQFRLNRISPEDADWLAKSMDRECRRLGGRVSLSRGALRLDAHARVT
jgi:poly-gamma-glutamate capsule biosynthesis protein CapA/YwtB (metallophosphatase superfamily)